VHLDVVVVRLMQLPVDEGRLVQWIDVGLRDEIIWYGGKDASCPAGSVRCAEGQAIDYMRQVSHRRKYVLELGFHLDVEIPWHPKAHGVIRFRRSL